MKKATRKTAVRKALAKKAIKKTVTKKAAGRMTEKAVKALRRPARKTVRKA